MTMRDFTRKTYRKLLEALLLAGYRLIPYEEYCLSGLLPERFIVLRHDVDKRPEESLRMAVLESEMGVRASYYFRARHIEQNRDVIETVAALGHEIGYHYEDLTLAKGDKEKAWAHFEKYVALLREIYPVRTATMHGALYGSWDGRKLWEKYDYHMCGIVGEVYLDTDFSEVVYLTDTGRCWDGFGVSLRDKVPAFQSLWEHAGYVYHTTWDILNGLGEHALPSRILMTIHPQRWTDNLFRWVYELVGQTLKNLVKRLLI